MNFKLFGKGSITDLFSSPDRKYTPRIVSGRLVVEVPKPDGGKIHIGNIVDAEYFPSDWFTSSQIAIFNAKDERVQRVMRTQNPRKNSGLFPHSHLSNGVFKEAVTTAQQAGLRFDFPTALMLLGHDFYEDNPSLLSLIEKWSNAVVEDNYQLAARLDKKVTHRRNQMRIAHGNDLISIAQSLGGMTAIELRDLSKMIEAAERGNYNLTRFHNNTYAHSIDFEYNRQRNEPLSKTLRRTFVKNVDTTSNNAEISPLEKSVMEQVDYAFTDEEEHHGYVIGPYLQEHFGQVSKRGKEMSRSRKLRRGFTSMLKLLNMNHFENRWAEHVLTGHNQQEIDYYRLVWASRARLVQSANAILQTAKSEYESEPYVRKHIKNVDAEIERWHRDGNYMHIRAGDEKNRGGIVIPMILADAAGQRHFDIIEKEDSGLLFCYRAVRHTLELLALTSTFHEGLRQEGRPHPEWKKDMEHYNPVHGHKLYELKNYKSVALSIIPDMKTIRVFDKT